MTPNARLRASWDRTCACVALFYFGKRTIAHCTTVFSLHLDNSFPFVLPLTTRRRTFCPRFPRSKVAVHRRQHDVTWKFVATLDFLRMA